ncbi:MAG: hypothetical protein WBG30_09340 [Psychrilyobacter sp.]|uniref:hypothetical protein n=1 Tax=Psychrilyobacter sp. TaxID=2586924 RepID=UPI003C78A02B
MDKIYRILTNKDFTDKIYNILMNKDFTDKIFKISLLVLVYLILKLVMDKTVG